MDDKLNKVKIDEGIVVNGTKINCLKDVKISSDTYNVSEITLTFYGQVEGIDYLKNEVKGRDFFYDISKSNDV